MEAAVDGWLVVTLSVLGVLLLLVVVAGATFLLGMRRKVPFVLDLVRRNNRRMMNPRQMRTAGTPGAYASVVRHVGRRSGRAYETPVVPFPTGDGFVVPLPYGDRADWVRNVLAAGSATLVHEGTTYPVDHPELVPVATMRDAFPRSELRNLRAFAVDRCMTLHVVR
jgi:deazaflavin-dependent oxidoreductase (nitroreductase family)